MNDIIKEALRVIDARDDSWKNDLREEQMARDFATRKMKQQKQLVKKGNRKKVK